jgi:hypothetical protein
MPVGKSQEAWAVGQSEEATAKCTNGPCWDRRDSRQA